MSAASHCGLFLEWKLRRTTQFVGPCPTKGVSARLVVQLVPQPAGLGRTANGVRKKRGAGERRSRARAGGVGGRSSSAQPHTPHPSPRRRTRRQVLQLHPRPHGGVGVVQQHLPHCEHFDAVGAQRRAERAVLRRALPHVHRPLVPARAGRAGRAGRASPAGGGDVRSRPQPAPPRARSLSPSRRTHRLPAGCSAPISWLCRSGSQTRHTSALSFSCSCARAVAQRRRGARDGEGGGPRARWATATPFQRLSDAPGR